MTPLLLEGGTFLTSIHSPCRGRAIWIELAQLVPALCFVYPMALLCRHSCPSERNCLGHHTLDNLRATIVIITVDTQVVGSGLVLCFHLGGSEQQAAERVWLSDVGLKSSPTNIVAT